MPKRKQQQKDAHDPGQLAGILVGPVQEDLGQMRQDQDHHARAGVVVQGAEEPAQRLLVIQKQQAFIGLVGGRHVHQRQADPGDNLDHEERERGAAENVPPALRPCDRLRDGVAQHGAQTRAGSSGRRTTPPEHAATVSSRPPVHLSLWERSRMQETLHPLSLHQRVLQGRVMRRLDLQPAVAHPPGAVEQAAGRGARGTVAVGVVHAAMTGAHEQTGLREPGDRAAQVGAIDGQHQELRYSLSSTPRLRT